MSILDKVDDHEDLSVEELIAAARYQQEVWDVSWNFDSNEVDRAVTIASKLAAALQDIAGIDDKVLAIALVEDNLPKGAK